MKSSIELAPVKADLYVLLGLTSEPFWRSLKLENPDERLRGFGRRDEEVLCTAQVLPKGLEDWRYELVDIDPASVAGREIPRVMPSASLALIPDTLDWTPLRLVSARLRAFLEAEFPDGSRFYDCHIKDADTGTVTQPDFWYWLPRHYLTFVPAKIRSKDQQMRPQTWGALGGLGDTWEMHHNRAFQDFAASLPFWTPSPRFSEVVFSPDVYGRLREAGFTGFFEAKEDNYLRQEPHENVGYVRFAPPELAPQKKPRLFWRG